MRVILATFSTRHPPHSVLIRNNVQHRHSLLLGLVIDRIEAPQNAALDGGGYLTGKSAVEEIALLLHVLVHLVLNVDLLLLVARKGGEEVGNHALLLEEILLLEVVQTYQEGHIAGRQVAVNKSRKINLFNEL